MSDSRLFVGLMSGTSCDGVDAALVRVNGHGEAMRADFLHLTSVPYTDADRQLVQSARHDKLGLADLAGGAGQIARRYAEAVQKLLVETATPAARVTALAAHGQTIFHAPPLTWQLFDPTVLAYETGIDVVSDFRRADCAAGGQGAPLVPFGDWVLFRHATTTRVIVNIGGIANVTILPAGATLAEISGHDIGPGNCLSDWLMRYDGGVDVNGALARTGKPIWPVVNAFQNDPYFRRFGPKSTDVPHMIGLFKAALDYAPDASLADRLASANEIVAAEVANQIRLQDGSFEHPSEAYIAGGGVHNRDLLDRVQGRGAFPHPTDELGVPTQAREAVAFALLAVAYVDRLPCYMPKVTGVTRPVILGSLTPAFGPLSWQAGSA